ncbi:MAG: FtsX-like permease family protein [Imperialibacter sp.]
MKTKQSSSPRIDGPPPWASRLLEWYCRPSLYEDLQGDLLEYFERNKEAKGARYARFIYIIDVLKFFRLYTVQKPQIFKGVGQFVLLSNYFKTSVRSMGRSKLFTSINVAGLSLSMMVGLFMISMLFEIRSFDSFHDKGNRIYRLVNTMTMDETHQYATTSILAGQRVSKESPAVENAVFVNGEFEKDVKAGEKVIQLSGDFASEEFFSVFSYQLIEGNPATALSEPFSLVLTQATAEKLFGHDEAMGQTVEIDGKETYTVTGIMKDVPTNSHRQFDCLASFSTYLAHEVKKKGGSGWEMSWVTMWDTYVYLLLAESADPAVLQPILDQIAVEENERDANDWTVTLALQPLKRIMHEGLYNQPPVLDEKTVWFMSLLTVFVIVSSSFNYSNLSIARALRRTKEVGIRKVIGATKSQVMLQFLVEAVVLAVLSVLVAIGLFSLLRGEFQDFMESFTKVRLSLPLWRLSLLFIAFAVVIGLLSGLLPALLFSNMKAFHVLKGVASVKNERGGFFRTALVVFQYSMSVAFIVGASIVYHQYLFSRDFNLGYNTHNVLNIELQGNQADVLKAEIERIPGVLSVSQSGMVGSTGARWSDELILSDPKDTVLVFNNPVDENYLGVFEHKLVAGRNLRHQSNDNAMPEVLVNETFVKRLGLSDPELIVGKKVGSDMGIKLVVVGVVEDFHYATVRDPIEPFYFYNKPFYKYLNVRLDKSDIMATRERINEKWGKLDKIHPFKATFHDEGIEKVYQKYQAISEAIGFLAILSISIASMGLLGMVFFTSQGRLKEISIIKVLGAGELHLIRLLGQGFIVLLVVSVFIGVPLAWYLSNQYFTQEFTYRVTPGLIDLFGGVALIFVIALLAIGSQTLKAARTNPAQILRNE